MFGSETQSVHRKYQGTEGIGEWQVSSKCPQMGPFMPLGFKKRISRFREILNTDMEKIPAPELNA